MKSVFSSLSLMIAPLTEDLHGTGQNTWGDWTEGVNYPIIDNAGNIFSSYQNTYYPTLYTVCPNGLLNQIGQASYNIHVNYVESTDCAAASFPSDARILSLYRCHSQLSWRACSFERSRYEQWNRTDDIVHLRSDHAFRHRIVVVRMVGQLGYV